MARFILIGLYTGKRAGEICGAAIGPAIGRGYVDLDLGLFFRKAPGTKQTKKRQPTCIIPDRLLAYMRRWQHVGVSNSSVIEWHGAPIKRISKAFRSARCLAGLGDDVIPHSLRHTCVTWLLQAGIDPWQVAGFVGMSIQMIKERYGHHSPDYQGDVAKTTFRAPESSVSSRQVMQRPSGDAGDGLGGGKQWGPSVSPTGGVTAPPAVPCDPGV